MIWLYNSISSLIVMRHDIHGRNERKAMKPLALMIMKSITNEEVTTKGVVTSYL